MRSILAVLTALLATQTAVAFDASKYGSSTHNVPDAEKLINQSPSSPIDLSGMSVTPNVSATLGTLSRQLGDLGSGVIAVSPAGVMTGLTGVHVKGSPGTSLFTLPAINVADGALLYSANNDFKTAKGLEIIGSKIQLEPTEAVNIYPTPGSYAKALNIVQSAPPSGSVVGPFSFNKIEATWRSAVTGDGTFGLAGSGSVSGLQTSLNVGGANFLATSAFGGSFGINQLSTDPVRNPGTGAPFTANNDDQPDIVGLTGGVFLDAKTRSNVYGGSSGVTFGPNASNSGVPGGIVQTKGMIGHEVDLDIKSGTGTFTGSIRGTTLTVTAVGTQVRVPGPNASTIIPRGTALAGSRVAAGTFVGNQTSGTADGVGTYDVFPSQNVASSTMTSTWSGKAAFRFGFNAANQGSGTAQVLDTAFSAMTLGFPGSSTGRWKNLLTITNANGELPNALADNANIIHSDHTATVANFANLGNVTVTGNILNFPGVVLTGAGKMTTAAAELYAEPPFVGPGKVGYGGKVVASSFCGSLPGAAGCLIINVAGTRRYVPFY